MSRVAAGVFIAHGASHVCLSRGDVAQLGERGLCKPEVVGSNPIVSTIERPARGLPAPGFLFAQPTAVLELTSFSSSSSHLLGRVSGGVHRRSASYH